jgi:hypothetical protein
MNTPRSVKTLLELPELRLRLRTGADLLDRTVSRIYGTELPDPGRYVSAGEMVLSGLLWWRGPGDAEPFVAALAHAGAARWPRPGRTPAAFPRISSTRAPGTGSRCWKYRRTCRSR